MEINYNPTVLRDVRLPEIIEFETETYLTSESNTFVCFAGDAKIQFKGTLPECYVYSKYWRRQKGFDVVIYSIEAYNSMMERGGMLS